MLKIYSSQITDHLWAKGIGPNLLKREDLIYGLRFEYKKESLIRFTILYNDKFHDVFGYEYTKFDKIFSEEKSKWPIHDLISILGKMDIWLKEIEIFERELNTIDPWDTLHFIPPKELTSGIQTINFNKKRRFTEKEQNLVSDDLDKTKKFIREEVLPDNYDRIALIEESIEELKAELKNMTKFSWKAFLKEKMVDVIFNTAIDQSSFTKLWNLFSSFLDDLNIPLLGN